MISGLNTPGIASAIRTAGQARATMDTMTRQIATGQKVASVKDDGAAWARAAGLKSQRVVETTREHIIARVEGGLAFTQAITDTASQVMNSLREIVLKARTTAVGSQSRQTLLADWNATLAMMPASTEKSPFLEDWSTHTIAGSLTTTQDPMLASSRFLMFQQQNGFSGWMSTTGVGIPVALTAFDFANATSAQFDQVTSSINWIDDNVILLWDRGVGTDMNEIASVARATSRNIDRIDGAVASLTDADLGKASAARAQAETRQQLALSTVRQAISTYGNFASGLLGNVQRIQRGIMA